LESLLLHEMHPLSEKGAKTEKGFGMRSGTDNRQISGASEPFNAKGKIIGNCSACVGTGFVPRMVKPVSQELLYKKISVQGKVHLGILHVGLDKLWA